MDKVVIRYLYFIFVNFICWNSSLTGFPRGGHHRTALVSPPHGIDGLVKVKFVFIIINIYNL